MADLHQYYRRDLLSLHVEDCLLHYRKVSVLSSGAPTTRALHYVVTRVVLAKRVPADRTIGWHGPHNR